MTATPHRITRWQWTRARIAILAGLDTPHPGADENWATELRRIDARLDDTIVIPAVRQPIGALTAAPHWEACDELGPWNPSQHQLEPARIHDALTGATR